MPYKNLMINRPIFQAEAAESSSDRYETGNAELSLHDLSSKSPKDCSLTEISEIL